MKTQIYPNTKVIKYEPAIKDLQFEIFGENYRVCTGLKRLQKVRKLAKQLDTAEDELEIIFKILDLLFFDGFTDKIDSIEPNFPFEDFFIQVMDAVEGNYPTEPVEEEKKDENEEPKKE